METFTETHDHQYGTATAFRILFRFKSEIADKNITILDQQLEGSEGPQQH